MKKLATLFLAGLVATVLIGCSAPEEGDPAASTGGNTGSTATTGATAATTTGTTTG